MKAKATLVFLKIEKKIHAQRRQKTIDTIPVVKEGDTRADRSIPPARLKVRKRKGNSILHTIDEEPLQCVSDAQGSRIKGGT
jgi:hypothetical protein